MRTPSPDLPDVPPATLDLGGAKAALESGDFDAVADAGLDWLRVYGPGLVGRTVAALAILVVGLVVARALGGMARRALGRARVEVTLSTFLAKMVRYAVLALVAVMALGVFGVPVTGFAAVLAAAGFAVGMALSGTLGHFAAGVLLLVFRPFKAGDVIRVAGVTGRVHEIELFTTAINTFDNRRFVVPNGEVYGGVIENTTHHPIRRVDVPVGVSYDADIDETKRMLIAAVAATQGVLPDPPAVVYLDGLGESSVDYVVRAWAATADYWAVKEALVRNVKYGLDAAGINIPYPQRDIHLHQAT